ncbi:MAG: squalene/phytoene synthase family protein [Myxococcota bacterium]
MQAALLDELLQKTSRTFALAIPLLPEPTRQAVGLAYLVLRIADTFEDATRWAPERRRDALERLARVMRLSGDARVVAARELVDWAMETPPVDDTNYLTLLRETAEVFAGVNALSPGLERAVIAHSLRTAEGMERVVARIDARGNLQLTSVRDLQDYCYLVAGIVGELLTDVFLHDCPALERERDALTAEMVAFGEGLQLVNILKDAADDARDGRVYLPPGVERAALFALARADLLAGNRYVQALQRGGAPRGYLSFCGLSLTLAFKALDVLEAHGAGKKVSREEVAHLFGALEAQLDAGGQLELAPRNQR